MEAFKGTESIEISVSQGTIRKVKNEPDETNIRFSDTTTDLVKVGMTSTSAS